MSSSERELRAVEEPRSAPRWPTGAQLDALSRGGLDGLPFGVVELDARGVITSYNAAEARMTGLAPADVVGRPFFREVAPCTAVPEFEGRFRRGVAAGELDAAFEFDFNFVLAPVRVAVRLLSSPSGRYWLLTHVVAQRARPSDGDERAWQRNVQRDLDLERVDHEACAQEPIHLAGAIQAFGALVAIDADSGEVVAADEHSKELFGRGPLELLGRHHSEVLHEALARLVERARRTPDLAEVGHVVLGEDPLLDVHAYVHRWDDRVLCELVPSASPERLLHELARADDHIQRAAPDDVWRVACHELAALTGYDRVLGYAMEGQGDGRVVAEALRDAERQRDRDGGERSLLGLAFPAADIPAQARQLYVRSKSRYCPNVAYVPRRVLAAPGERPVDLSFAQLRSLSPYHVQYQRNLGVAAASSFSVVVEGELRGLLITHHFTPFVQSHEQRIASRMVAQFLERALTNGERRALAERRLEATAAYGALIHEITGWGARGEPQAGALGPLAATFDADGAAVQVGDRLVCSDPADEDWAREVFARLHGRAATGPHRDVERAENGTRAVLMLAPANGVALRLLAYRSPRTEVRVWGRGAKTLPGAIERWEESRRRAVRRWGALEQELAGRLHEELAEAVGPLLDARHLFERVVETAPLGVVMLSAEHVVVAHNSLAASLLGADLLGAPLQDRLAEWEPLDGVVPEMGVGGEGPSAIPMRVRTLSLAFGRVARVVFLQDLRAIRELESSLADAKRMQAAATLASGLAHDFNNTLAVILTTASLLREDWTGAPGDHALLEDLIVAADQGREIAHQMLAFSRSARREEDGPSSLREVVGESDRMLAALAGRSVQVSLEVADDPLPVLLSRGRIQQLLFNLVANARDVQPAQIHVRTARTPAGAALLEVRDDGPGFPAEVLEHAFEPFFTTKARSRGTGLGLYVVAGIARSVGGRVEAFNDGGAVVHIELPIAPPGEPEAPRERRLSTVPPGASRILLVEDNELVRRGVQIVLDRAGYEVEPCADGAAGLAAFERELPALLITDLSMEGMSGVELVQAIQHTGVPCLIFTGHGPPPELGELTTRVEVLTKPALPAQIRAAVAALLDA
ncbi:MAG: hypothetical protein CMN30_29500 [Sandaracinus sp.]|nr:hypothetical protein [Sandaracinus sp.]